jgi:hypothetical protein
MFRILEKWEKFYENYLMLVSVLEVVDIFLYPSKHMMIHDKIYSDFLNFCEKVEKHEKNIKDGKKIVSVLYHISECISDNIKANCLDGIKTCIQKTNDYFEGISPLHEEDDKIPIFECYSEYLQEIYTEICNELNTLNLSSEKTELTIIQPNEEEEKILKTVSVEEQSVKDNEQKICKEIVEFMNKKNRKPNKTIKSEKEMAEFYFTQRKKYIDKSIDYDNLVLLFYKMR